MITALPDQQGVKAAGRTNNTGVFWLLIGKCALKYWKWKYAHVSYNLARAVGMRYGYSKVRYMLCPGDAVVPNDYENHD